ncbi:beta strand repeat-containing protein [Pararhizobium gei]|uniref:beta strand repeat-containing protein n=1 Tax=Pararhizobium gei TaxID=1395951 RepID=UPI0023DB5D36|nr:calcium-binding protein [Rhizobium gei]
MAINTLETFGSNISGTIAYFENFDQIVVSIDDPTSAIELSLTNGGALDLTDELQIDGGGARNAVMFASALGNTITTGAGDDTLYGGNGNDILNGGAGNDTLDGADGNDTLNGGDGNDSISDYEGTSTAISGGIGNDTITIGVGTGTIDAGAGDDVIDTSNNVSMNIDGGLGTDMLYSGPTLGTGTITGIEILTTNGYEVQGAVSQFESFTSIIFNLDFTDEEVNLRLTNSGVVDLLDELSGRSATISASNFGNTITTGALDDTLYGGAGNDTLNGGAGNDTLDGADGNDALNGGDGNDSISDYEGTSTAISGGIGNDTITIGVGTGTIDAGAGDDVIDTSSTSSNGAMNIDGGMGTDTLYSGHTFGTGTITGIEILATNGYEVQGTVSQFESFTSIIFNLDFPGEPVNLRLTNGGAVDLLDELTGRSATISASNFGNTITASALDDALYGGAGNDTLNGGTGNDTLDGANGNDTLNGGDGNDTITDYEGTSTAISGGIGSDTITTVMGTGTIDAGAGDDVIDTSSNVSMNIDGGLGTDTLYSGQTLGTGTITGVEILVTNGYEVQGTVSQFESFTSIIFNPDFPGEPVNLRLTNGGAVDLLDELTGRSGAIFASDFGNTINTGALDDALYGGAGNDTLTGGAGNDTLNGADGNDTLNGGDGNDTITDYEGTTTAISGGIGNDTITSWVGTGTIDAGAGDDVIDTSNNVSMNIDGGLGTDTLYSGQTLGTGTITGVEVLATNGNEVEGTVSQFESFTSIIYRPDFPGEPVNLRLTNGGAVDLLDELSGRSATIVASDFGNTITTGALDDALYGRAGNDTLSGGAGNDTLDGADGNDTLNGGDGNDTITDYEGTTTAISGGIGNDTITSWVGTGTIDAGAGDDVIDTSNNVSMNIDGGLGTDTLYSGQTLGTGTITGVEVLATNGNEVEGTVSQFESFTSIIYRPDFPGEPVNLRLTNGGTADLKDELSGRSATIFASTLGNTIVTSTGDDFLYGAEGDDTLDGGAGTNSLNGGEGSDTYIVDSKILDLIYEDAFASGKDTVRSSITYTLEDSLENLVLTGVAAINGTGNGFVNSLTGNSGDNILNGGAGADAMAGGAGNDTYLVDNSGDTIAEIAGGGTDTVQSSVTLTLSAEVERLTLTGAAAINGTGNSLANLIIGNAAANVLDGKTGADTLQGLGGNDIYTVDNAGDQVIEAAGQGSDIVQTAVSYALAAGQEIETLRVVGAAGVTAVNLSGNEFANTLQGNAGANVLDGKAGVDALYGLGGNDIYQVDNIGDKVLEAAGNGTDTVQSSVSFALAAGQEIEILRLLGSTGSTALNLSGNEFANTLQGNAGANVLDGKTGVDALYGLGGNDTYQVDNAADKVFENAGNGTDTVQTTVTFSLAAGQEIETLRLVGSTGSTALNLSGNEFANTLQGNAGANVLDGKAGADTLQGFAGNDIYQVDNATDKVLEAIGNGTDTVQATISFTLAAGEEIETLRLLASTGSAALNLGGNEFANTLQGNGGANVLDGKAGADTLQGLAGNDIYQIDNIADKVMEAAGNGTDTVQTVVSYALAAGQEIETLRLLGSTGSTALNLSGNEFANTLQGNAGANVLDGRAGTDLLQGGAGADTFLFTTTAGSSNIDSIVDFSVVDDVIRLAANVYTSLTAGGLAQGAFKDLASGAVDADDRILYDRTTGAVFYDADGSGSGATAVQLAILNNKAALTHQDFLIA